MRGSLKVTRPHLTAAADDVLLVPNGRLVFSKAGAGDGVATLEHNINAAQAAAWKDGWHTASLRKSRSKELARKDGAPLRYIGTFQDAGLRASIVSPVVYAS